ncbi:LamB/YcsF family protein [Amycolatopsis sacchari]|uniref:LamB/YcsF family protein n=1 Tax=Amycolatopsis sacchari TaxID=115433 RepID=UPI003D749426
MRIDLNCDAEGRLPDVLTAANVRCGCHAGAARTMREVCEAAVKRGVAIGALVGYRHGADVTETELVDDVLYQLGALDAIAGSAGGEVRYVKARVRDEHAAAVVDAIWQYDPQLPVLGPPGSALLRHAAENGLVTVVEAFPDRHYHPDGRPLPGAPLSNPDEIASRCLRLVTRGEVVAVDGTVIPLRADSLSVHGDNSTTVHRALDAAGVELRSFA